MTSSVRTLLVVAALTALSGTQAWSLGPPPGAPSAPAPSDVANAGKDAVDKGAGAAKDTVDKGAGAVRDAAKQAAQDALNKWIPEAVKKVEDAAKATKDKVKAAATKANEEAAKTRDAAEKKTIEAAHATVKTAQAAGHVTVQGAKVVGHAADQGATKTVEQVAGRPTDDGTIEPRTDAYPVGSLPQSPTMKLTAADQISINEAAIVGFDGADLAGCTFYVTFPCQGGTTTWRVPFVADMSQSATRVILKVRPMTISMPAASGNSPPATSSNGAVIPAQSTYVQDCRPSLHLVPGQASIEARRGNQRSTGLLFNFTPLMEKVIFSPPTANPGIACHSDPSDVTDKSLVCNNCDAIHIVHGHILGPCKGKDMLFQGKTLQDGFTFDSLSITSPLIPSGISVPVSATATRQPTPGDKKLETEIQWSVNLGQLPFTGMGYSVTYTVNGPIGVTPTIK